MRLQKTPSEPRNPPRGAARGSLSARQTDLRLARIILLGVAFSGLWGWGSWFFGNWLSSLGIGVGLGLFSLGFDLDELVIGISHFGFSDFFDKTAKSLFASFDNGIGHTTGVQDNGFSRVVVARYDVIDTFRRVVSIDHSNNRNTQFLCFSNGNFVIANIDNKHGIRKIIHVFDATNRTMQLLEFALEQQAFFFGEVIDAALFELGFHFFEATDGCANRFEVSHHAAKPAVANIGHAATRGFFFDNFARCALGTYKQNSATVGGNALHILCRFVIFNNRVFEVDDVNFVTLPKDVRSHLGVPETGLVAKVHARFEHVSHK